MKPGMELCVQRAYCIRFAFAPLPAQPQLNSAQPVWPAPSNRPPASGAEPECHVLWARAHVPGRGVPAHRAQRHQRVGDLQHQQHHALRGGAQAGGSRWCCRRRASSRVVPCRAVAAAGMGRGLCPCTSELQGQPPSSYVPLPAPPQPQGAVDGDGNPVDVRLYRALWSLQVRGRQHCAPTLTLVSSSHSTLHGEHSTAHTRHTRGWTSLVIFRWRSRP